MADRRQDLAGVALVTGAAGALGAEVARILHQRGCKLALVDTEQGKERLERLAASLGDASIVAGDISAQATWSTALPRIQRELGDPPSLAALIAGAWRGGKPIHEDENE